MLDVHAPEHRVGSVRDFLLHLFTITVGLLIALGLENAAESLHHRQQRREAETNIRQELRGNQELLTKGGPQVSSESAALLKLMAALETRSSGGKMPDMSGMTASFNESPIPDAAWRTASSTGVLDFMSYEEVEHFAEAYKEQDMLQAEEEKALDDYLDFTPIMQNHGADLTPAQARDALLPVRQAIAHLNGMLALGQGTLHAYDEALK